MKKIKILAALLLGLVMMPLSAHAASGWKNPVTLPGQQAYDVGDPQVMKYRGVYYLYCSSGTKSILCWSSRDLINWSDATVVCDDPIVVDGYAPEVKYWNGTFYMVTSPNGNGHYVLTSDSPTGPFKVMTDNLGQLIDGSIFIDDDGQWYFYHAHGSGIKGNLMPTHLSFGTDVDLNACMNGTWTEGPGVFKRNGIYYLIYTGNHVLTNGYRIDYAVNTEGPLARYTPQAEQNPILISADGIDNHYGLGHGSAFIGPDLDSYYFCYHNMTRNSGVTQRKLDFDRIAWNGDKLMMLGNTTWQQDAPIVAPNDYFDRAELGSDWTTSGGTWAIEGSDHLAQTAAVGDAVAVFTPHSYDSYTAEFTVRLGAGSTEGRFGAVYSYADGQDWQEAVLNAAEGKLELYACTAAGARTLTGSYALVGDFDPHAWHSVRLEKSGTALKVFVDDLLRATVACASEGGSVGYVSHGCTADFSYIALSPYVGGSGILDVNLPVPGIIAASLCKESGNGARRESMRLPYGSCEVMGLPAGAWLQYNVNTRLKTVYNMGLRYKATAPARVRLLAGGNVVKDDITLPSTGGVWMVAAIDDIAMPAGRTTLRLETIEGEPTVYEMLVRRGMASPKVLSDNFDAGLSGQWKHREGTWTVADGKAVSPRYGKMVMGGTTEIGMTDYTVECDVTCTDNMNAGLIFRSNNLSIGGANDNVQEGTDFQQGYYLGLGTNQLVLGKQNYGWTLLATKNRSFYTSQAYHLKVVVEGATIKCYVGNEKNPSITYTDPLPFISGRAGLRTHNCLAKFDNFSITPITPTTAIEGVTSDGTLPTGRCALYTATGIKMAEGDSADALLEAVPGGMYIVKAADGAAKKVLKR